MNIIFESYMNIEELRDYCLSKPGTTEGLPFGEDTLVFKIGEKIFLLISLTASNRFNVKCDPERAVTLREQYEEIIPGFHMNKKHWNTIYMDGRLTFRQLQENIDHSYKLVYHSLPKKIQEEIRESNTL
ncbi:putative DNA-binding protein (MmcQ/YjbR family) [Pedobacter cryoconitis]|uniref:Putative DNA-binding protein (MmcQ/YjbR family) n=1 Tax=Pedobacter cryoconitis TaxID=188932 RepID=A0A7W9E0R8_9SPHI|nr:MmcQ/YjbR family DNA-binding protein [Pedobacter cryoconitis]MBB5636895.1 putative DNA-binding protein (MmcQ/YjbR family) [Pedobacter cryoconitis]